MIASLLIAFVADAVYLRQPDETFGLSGWLWLVGIAALITSVAAWPLSSSPGPLSYNTDIQEQTGRWPGWEITLLAAIVLLALGLRVCNLRDFPNNIYPDEIMTGQLSVSSYLDNGGHGPSVFSTLWSGIDLPALWFLVVAGSLKIGGITLAALRLPAALFGAATVLPLYGLERMLWGRVAAISGAAILAFSAADVHYSRLGLNNIVTPFFWTACFFFLLRGLRSRRPIDWALAGIAAGLSEYGFYATRLLPFLLLAFAAYLLIVHRRWSRYYLAHFGLLAVAYIVSFGPLLAHFISYPSLYTGHGASVLAWDHIPRSPDDFGLMVSTLWPIFAQNLLGFSTLSSQDIIYFAPLLMPAEAALLVLGAALLIWNWRRPASFLMLLAGMGVLIVGGTLVKGAPAINHWTAAFPTFYAAIAVPIGAWGAQVSKLPSPKWRLWAPGALAVGITILGLLNIRFYFNEYDANPNVLLGPRYKTAQQDYEVQTAMSRYLGSLGPDYVARTVGKTTVSYDPQTTTYLSGTRDFGNIPDPLNGPHMQPRGNKGLVFIFLPGSEQYRASVQSLYPGGTSGEVASQVGHHLFYTYVIRPR